MRRKREKAPDGAPPIPPPDAQRAVVAELQHATVGTSPRPATATPITANLVIKQPTTSIGTRGQQRNGALCLAPWSVSCGYAPRFSISFGCRFCLQFTRDAAASAVCNSWSFLTLAALSAS